VVAWEGSAPSISGCRPDVMLFHHQAVEARLARTGCRGWNCTSIRAFKGRCPTIRRPGNTWWSARVTRPVLRIKSPLHHFNACRPKIGARGCLRTATIPIRRVGGSLQRLGLHERNLEPHPELHRTVSHTKGVHRSKCFGDVKSGVPRRMDFPSLAS
jgi:hypothetical protein